MSCFAITLYVRRKVPSGSASEREIVSARLFIPIARFHVRCSRAATHAAVTSVPWYVMRGCAYRISPAISRVPVGDVPRHRRDRRRTRELRHDQHHATVEKDDIAVGWVCPHEYVREPLSPVTLEGDLVPGLIADGAVHRECLIGLAHFFGVGLGLGATKTKAPTVVVTGLGAKSFGSSNQKAPT